MPIETPNEYIDNENEIEADLKFLENEIQAFQEVFDELTGKGCINIDKFMVLFSDQRRNCRKGDRNNSTTKATSGKPALKPKPFVKVKPKLMPKPKLDEKANVLAHKNKSP